MEGEGNSRSLEQLSQSWAATLWSSLSIKLSPLSHGASTTLSAVKQAHRSPKGVIIFRLKIIYILEKHPLFKSFQQYCVKLSNGQNSPLLLN